MEGPICLEDAKAGKLCRLCEAKLKAGKIGEIDVKVMKELSKLHEKSLLVGVEFLKAFGFNGFILLFAVGNIGALIGKEGKNVKSLSQALGKKVRIIEANKPEKQVSQEILGNARILALNKVFEPEKELYKLIVSKDSRKVIDAEKDCFEKALGFALKSPATIEFQ